MTKFWFEYEVPYAKILVGRVVLFGLLAADALLQLRHAPRYGAGFNVAQLPGLDALAPGRVGFGVCELVLAYLFVMIAFGLATRWLLPIATVIYAWLYFGSQLDSYQHHYLVAMILLVACFVPWQRSVDPVKSWAVRLILVELGIVYLWAAISKLDMQWPDALAGQIHGNLRGLIDHTVGIKVVAIMVPVTELVLVWVWVKPLAKYLAPLGIAFHLGIVWSGLEVGLFAWLMIGLYVFVIPDAWFPRIPTVEVARPRLYVGVALVVGVGLLLLTRFPYALGVGIVATVITGAIAWVRPRTSIAFAHVAAIALWCATDRTSLVTRDYYKFWGGTARRLGDADGALTAYRHWAELAPDDATARYYFGRSLLDRDDPSGVDELHAAQRLDTRHARAYNAEARWLATHGRSAEAIAKARDGANAEPNDAEARNLLDALTRQKAPPAAHD